MVRLYSSGQQLESKSRRGALDLRFHKMLSTTVRCSFHCLPGCPFLGKNGAIYFSTSCPSACARLWALYLPNNLSFGGPKWSPENTPALRRLGYSPSEQSAEAHAVRITSLAFLGSIAVYSVIDPSAPTIHASYTRRTSYASASVPSRRGGSTSLQTAVVSELSYHQTLPAKESLASLTRVSTLAGEPDPSRRETLPANLSTATA